MENIVIAVLAKWSTGILIPSRPIGVDKVSERGLGFPVVEFRVTHRATFSDIQQTSTIESKCLCGVGVRVTGLYLCRTRWPVSLNARTGPLLPRGGPS